VGARFFAHMQTSPGAHPASCTMGTGSILGVKHPGRGADHPPPPSTGLRMCRATPLLPLWALGGLLDGDLCYTSGKMVETCCLNVLISTYVVLDSLTISLLLSYIYIYIYIYI
jgi:hypothetical protein